MLLADYDGVIIGDRSYAVEQDAHRAGWKMTGANTWLTADGKSIKLCYDIHQLKGLSGKLVYLASDWMLANRMMLHQMKAEIALQRNVFMEEFKLGNFDD